LPLGTDATKLGPRVTRTLVPPRVLLVIPDVVWLRLYPWSCLVFTLNIGSYDELSMTGASSSFNLLRRRTFNCWHASFSLVSYSALLLVRLDLH